MNAKDYFEAMNANYRIPLDFKEQANQFGRLYELESDIGCPDEKMRTLTKRTNRRCRFCGQKYPEVSFKKDAHLFPEFLGNRYQLLESECDNCNAKFGKYEDHFSKFLGVERTMLSIKGKEKIPKFKSPGEKLIIESGLDENGMTLIKAVRSDILDTTFEFDKESLTTKIHFTKHPYIPLMVYKSLLKMALSCMPEKDLPLYKMAFDFIASDKYDLAWTGMTEVYRYRMPITYTYLKPAGFVFRKRDPDSTAYTHVFVLLALNSIYQLIVPFNAFDLKYVNRGEGIVLPWCPPIFGEDYPFDTTTIHRLHLDLSSNQAIKGETETIAMSMPEESYETLKMLDKVTGEIRVDDFDGTKIKGINFLRQDFNPDQK